MARSRASARPRRRDHRRLRSGSDRRLDLPLGKAQSGSKGACSPQRVDDLHAVVPDLVHTGGEGVAEVGEVARLQAGVSLLLQREGRGDPAQLLECLHLRPDAPPDALQQGEEVLEQCGSVWADDRASHGEPCRPAVAGKDNAGLLPEDDEAGDTAG
jgi:hypothetical protein